jgi:hypothetical protein
MLSWLWIAYDGYIRFPDEQEVPVSYVLRVKNLRYDDNRDRKHALVSNIGRLHPKCTMESDKKKVMPLWTFQRPQEVGFVMMSRTAKTSSKNVVL